MERFVRGNVIVTNFPFSDFTSSVKRPSVIVAILPGNDLIICPITSKKREDVYTISLSKDELKEGKIKVDSFIRAGRLVTIRKNLILYKIGTINDDKMKKVTETILKIFRNN